MTVLPGRCSVCGQRWGDLSLGVCSDCLDNDRLCWEDALFEEPHDTMEFYPPE